MAQLGEGLVAKETPGSIESLHYCSMLKRDATRQECRVRTGILVINRDHCAKGVEDGCNSPERACRACVVQEEGGKSGRVVAKGLCDFHLVNGPVKRRPANFAIDPNVLARAIANLRVSTAEEVPQPKPARVVLQPTLAVEAPVPIQVPAPVVSPQVSSPALPPVVPMVEDEAEGEAILERVRNAIKTSKYEEVEVERIEPMPGQPRKYFNQEKLVRLSLSLARDGQFQPGMLRYMEEPVGGVDRQLVDGERRWRGCIMAGVRTFRAMTMHIDDRSAQYVISVIANFNRENSTVLEVADSIRAMHEGLKIPMGKIAEMIGFTPGYCSNLYGLRNLVPEVRNMLDPEFQTHRQLPASAAVEICRLPHRLQLGLAQQLMNREINIRMLRGKVVEVSQEHGIPVRKRTLDTHSQRQGLERKIASFALSARSLRTQLEETPPPILTGWGTGHFRAYQAELTEAHEDVGKALQVFKQAESKRKNI